MRASGAIEPLRFVVDFGSVASHCDEVTAVGAEIDVALDQAQVLILRAARVALAVFGFAGRFVCRQTRQIGIPQRAGRVYFGRFTVETRDLPVPARERQLE
jgi:hypothetical protein